MRVELRWEEIENILMLFDQCASEGYLNWGDPAYNFMLRLKNMVEE